MTATELALAKMYYRLVYEKKSMKLKDVPKPYKILLDEYKKSLGK